MAVAKIYCNAQTSGSQVIQKLNTICQRSSNHLGRILKPLNCSRVILILSNPNLPTPDKYATIQLIAFLHSLITHKGYYDPSNL